MTEAEYWWGYAASSLDCVYNMVDENKDLREEDKIDIKDTLADIDGALEELKYYIGGIKNGSTEKVNESEE